MIYFSNINKIKFILLLFVVLCVFDVYIILIEDNNSKTTFNKNIWLEGSPEQPKICTGSFTVTLIPNYKSAYENTIDKNKVYKIGFNGDKIITVPLWTILKR